MSYRIESKSRAERRSAAVDRCGRVPADLNTTDDAARNRHPRDTAADFFSSTASRRTAGTHAAFPKSESEKQKCFVGPGDRADYTRAFLS
ncbi:hypothetical protein LGN43_10935 [Burkholderia multivorans]|uniref:hypothetical protein n=1 Tax=Burkholderia multivorans TaxID=87883 RepID=UPI001591D77D|nr:hypothetical protein [Burkholderia multivorans]MCA8314797.1 hypothetical protein [Burkholderia multivorans]